MLFCGIMTSIADRENSESAIIVRSPDTDVILLLLHYCMDIKSIVLFDTGSGDKRRLINMKKVLAENGTPFCKALLGFHAFTGCDTTSAFSRKGKLKPLKILKKHDHFCLPIQQLGCFKNVPEYISDTLETFVCAMYGKPNYLSVNRLRHDLIIQKFKAKSGLISVMEGTDMCYLPPCKPLFKITF